MFCNKPAKSLIKTFMTEQNAPKNAFLDSKVFKLVQVVEGLDSDPETSNKLSLENIIMMQADEPD